MYRRRRLVVFVLTLILLAAAVTGAVFGIRWLVQEQPWQNLPFLSDEPVAEESADPIPTILPTASPNGGGGPTPEPTEQEPEACANGALQVVAVTDQDTYQPEQNPKLSMELTNVGAVDCVVNVGTKQQRFVVSSGPDDWWRSTDCQVDPSDQWVTLEAGQTVSTVDPVTWDRTRSYDDTCDADNRPGAVGGGATYTLTVRLGEVTSAPNSFILY